MQRSITEDLKMIEATDIEKKSLEAHVELCAERYNALENRLDVLDEKIEDNNNMIREIRDMVSDMSSKRNDQIINWGLGLIGVFAGTTVWLLTHYVVK
jgi:uncharacterized coiled-coil DUF342 family protein